VVVDRKLLSNTSLSGAAIISIDASVYKYFNVRCEAGTNCRPRDPDKLSILGLCQQRCKRDAHATKQDVLKKKKKRIETTSQPIKHLNWGYRSGSEINGFLELTFSGRLGGRRRQLATPVVTRFLGHASVAARHV
jgi:hypothetical protein